jgi:copper chaperone CopZ
MKKKTFKLSGLHCASCNIVIEGELEDQLGVKAECSYHSQVVQVEFDPTKVTHDQIISIIEAQGYKVIGSD